MASISKEKRTKDGRRYYVISVSRGYGVTPYTMRWYRQTGWSDKYAQSRLKSDAGKFEADCKAGLILSRAEQKQKDAEAAAEAAKLRSVRDYGDNYFMPGKELTISENTRTSYRSMLDKNIYPIIGDVLLTDVNPAMCRKVLTEYQKKGSSHSSMIKLYVVLSMLFEAAFMDDLITVSPMLKVKRPVPRSDETPPEESDKYYTPQELSYIYSCLENEPLKWQAYIRLMADTGARRGEVCGVQWADIDFKTGEWTIRHNRQYTASAGAYDKRPKNRQARVVDVGEDTLNILRQLRMEQAATAISKWVFTQDGTAEPMFPQSPNKYFKKFGEKYGVKDFHPHKLRHTNVSHALQAGGDLASVSARAGHSDPSVTARIYTHTNNDGVRRVGQLARESVKQAGEQEDAQNEQQKAQNE